MLLYGNVTDYVSGTPRLEQLYGDPMGFSIKKLAKKTVKVAAKVTKPVVTVAKKTPVATVARATVNVAKKPTLSNIAKQTVKVAQATPVSMVAKAVPKPIVRSVTKAVKPVAKVAAPIVRNVVKAAPAIAKNPLVRSAVASTVPGGAAALSVYDRLTAAKKVIAPKPAPRPAARPAPKPAPAKQKVFAQKRAPTPAPRPRAPAPAQAPTPAPVQESGLAANKTLIMVGGGALLLLGIGAVIMSSKK